MILHLIIAGLVWFFYLFAFTKKLNVLKEHEDQVHIVIFIIFTILSCWFLSFIFPSLKDNFITNVIYIYAIAHSGFYTLGKLTKLNEKISAWLLTKKQS
jgi:hypothetical protein